MKTCSSENDHYVKIDSVDSTGWFFFASTRDHSSGTHSLYINGRGLKSYVWLDTPCTNNEKFTIGRFNPSGEQYFFHGQIDDISIYNRALTETEIQALYNFGN
jgi:hypothetical protein